MTRVGNLEGSGGRSDLEAKLKVSGFREGGREYNGAERKLDEIETEVSTPPPKGENYLYEK